MVLLQCKCCLKGRIHQTIGYRASSLLLIRTTAYTSSDEIMVQWLSKGEDLHLSNTLIQSLSYILYIINYVLSKVLWTQAIHGNWLTGKYLWSIIVLSRPLLKTSVDWCNLPFKFIKFIKINLNTLKQFLSIVKYCIQIQLTLIDIAT